MPHAIHCRQLVKRYDGKPPVEAVRGLDLLVEEGECFGLLGPNGAGKTTTLEILEGLLDATSGDVMLTTHYMDEAERLCDRVAIVDHGKTIALGTPGELIHQLGGENIVDFQLVPGSPPIDEANLSQLPSVRSARRDVDSYS